MTLRVGAIPVSFLSGVSPGVRYILRATFNAANQGYDDGVTYSTTDTGVNDGQLTVMEKDGTLAIVSNKLAFTAQVTPVWGDLGFYSQAITRALGRGLLLTMNRNAANKGCALFWKTDQTVTFGTYDVALEMLISGKWRIWNALGSYEAVAAYSAATDYRLAIVLGGYLSGVPWYQGQDKVTYTEGAAVYISGGTFTNWTKLWSVTQGSTATLYAAFTNFNATGTVDNLRVPEDTLEAVLQPNNLSLFASAGELSVYTPELGGGWAEDVGDWDTAGGTLTATALGIGTFTGLADSIYDAKITMPGAGVAAGGLVVRGSDYTGASEDYWYVKITPGTAGTDWELIEYVNGAPTQRASGDVDWVAATTYAIRAICDGQEISCFADGGDKITYGSAASGEAATIFGLRDEGNSNMLFDNVVMFARTSSVYDTVLDGV